MTSAADGGSDGRLSGADGDQAATIARLLPGTNIHEQTFLATDYLNHFNEIIMLLEILPDMPDCLEEAMAWEPKSYSDHFRESGFSDKELAVLAYEHCPPRYRAPFDRTIQQMDELVATGLAQLARIRGEGHDDLFALTAQNLSRNLQRLMDVAAAVIHGSVPTIEQRDIDRIMAV